MLLLISARPVLDYLGGDGNGDFRRGFRLNGDADEGGYHDQILPGQETGPHILQHLPHDDSY